jgi:Peptidase propeptide and YPEB domain
MRRSTLHALGLAAALLTAAGGTAAPGTAQGTTQGMAGLAPGELTDDQIRIVLQARGYSDLSGFERGGDAVRVPAARRYGEAVGPLALDPKTGQVRDEQPLTEAQARAMLQARGYSGISEVEREGDAIRVRGRRDGSPVELRLDPHTGTVTGQQATR